MAYMTIKLNKAVFMSLPTGVRLRCNRGTTNGPRWFSEPVAPNADRQAQWDRIKAVKLNARTFLFEINGEWVWPDQYFDNGKWNIPS